MRRVDAMIHGWGGVIDRMALALGLFGVLTLTGPARVEAAGADDVRLVKVGEFDLSRQMAAHGMARGQVAGMQAAAGALFFLVQSGPSSPTTQYLMRTDLTGKVAYALPLGLVDVLDWDVSPSKEVSLNVRSADDTSAEIRLYAPTGAYSGTEPVERDSYFACLARGSPGRVTRRGDVLRREAGGRGRAGHLDLKQTMRLGAVGVRLPGDQIAVVDLVNAEVNLFDLRTGAVRRVTLDGPEIAAARERYRGHEAGLQPRILAAAAADAAGNIYCVVSGFHPWEGAPVLVLDDAGRRERLLRCPIANAKGGFVGPSCIAVAGHRLELADESGGVLLFSLPEFTAAP